VNWGSSSCEVEAAVAALNGPRWIVTEIFIIGVQLLVLATFVALTVFYGIVFWHWRDDEKKHDLRHDCWPSSITTSKPAK
jgi:hypothetical protein